MGAIAPGVVIAITVVAINLLSDGVLRYIDVAQRRLPRMKKQRLEAMIDAIMRRADDAAMDQVQEGSHE